MVNLYCYNGYGTNFSVRPSDNPCNTNSGGNKTVVRGCYVLVNKPIISLFGRNNDFDLYLQWQARYLETYGMCQGLVAPTFVNSWINGTLFAFPFKNTTYFDRNTISNFIFIYIFWYK